MQEPLSSAEFDSNPATESSSSQPPTDALGQAAFSAGSSAPTPPDPALQRVAVLKEFQRRGMDMTALKAGLDKAKPEQLAKFFDLAADKLGVNAPVPADDKNYSGVGANITAATEAASFGAAKLSWAPLEAARQAITEKSALDERPFLDRWKENYKAITEGRATDLAKIHEELPGVTIPKIIPIIGGAKITAPEAIGTGISYSLAFPGAMAKTAAGTMLQVAAVETERSGIDAISKIVAGADPRETLTNAAKEIAGNVAGAGLLHTAGSAVAKTASTALDVTKLAAGKLAKLSPESQIIVDNLDRAKSIRNPAEAQQILSTATKQLADRFNKVKTELQKGINEENPHPIVEDVVNQGTDQLNQLANALAQDFTNAAKPVEVVQTHLKALATTVASMEDLYHRTYNQSLDTLAEHAKPGAVINLGTEINKLRENLAPTQVSPGADIRTVGGFLINKDGSIEFPSDTPASAKTFLKTLLTNPAPDFKSAVQLKQKLGAIIPWGDLDKMSPQFKALHEFYWSLGEKLSDPALTSEATVSGYKELLKAARGQNNIPGTGIFDILGKARSAAGGLYNGATAPDSISFLRHIDATLTHVENAASLVTQKTGAKGNPLATFTVEQQAAVKNTMSAVRDLIDVRTYGNANAALNALKEMAAKPSTDWSVATKTIVEKVGKIESVNDVKSALQKQRFGEVLKDAILDPTNKDKTTIARTYINKYAKSAAPALTELLDRAAHAERLEGVLKNANRVYDLISKTDANPELIRTVNLAAKLDPRIANLMLDADVASAMLKENPSILQTSMGRLEGGNVVAHSAVTGAAALAGKMAGIGTFGPTMAANVALMIYKNLANPTAMILFAERNGLRNPALSKSALLHLNKISAFASRAIAAMPKGKL